MRLATAVFWSLRYSSGFKHVTAMLVLPAVPMRYPRSSLMRRKESETMNAPRV